jgi:hypothetical protein
MPKSTHRLLFVILALAAGIIIVLMMIWLGAKSRGPLSNLLDRAGIIVSNVENKVILDKLSDKRKDKLAWFQPYLKQPDMFDDSRTIFLGIYDNMSAVSFENMFNLEKSLKTTFEFIHIYVAWGSKPEQAFPLKQVRAIYEMGSVPVITWEPWLSDFNADDFPGLRAPELRDKGGLADIAAGKYDTYIITWAQEAKNTENTLFIRLGHEMNDPYRYPWGPQNNKPADYVAAWIHVHEIFDSIGATNIKWIWSPHPSYGWFDAYYPGDKYVDWVGVNILNYGTVAAWSKWWSFKEMFGSHYNELAKYGKKIMIAEFGSLVVGGDRSKWFEDALANLPIDYPAVKSLLFFNYSTDQTTTQQVVDWTFLNDTTTVRSIEWQIHNWPDSLKAPGK